MLSSFLLSVSDSLSNWFIESPSSPSQSRKSYPCFKCRDNGFDNIMVFLAGRDESGKTVYVEEDGSAHQHKQVKQEQQQQQPEQQQSQQEGSTTLVTTEPTTTSMKIINAKLDRIIALLESH